MTWTSFHRRGEVLRDVIAAADQRRDGVLPRDVDGVSATFADDLELLGALQLKWHTRLAGRIEREQMHAAHGPARLRGARLAPDRRRAARRPGDPRRAAGPTRRRGDRRDDAHVRGEGAHAPGRDGRRGECRTTTRAAAVGARIESEALATWAAYDPLAGLDDPDDPDDDRPSLLGRLKAALAA